LSAGFDQNRLQFTDRIRNPLPERINPMPLTHAELDRATRAHMQANRIVGLAACRVQDGDIVWENGFGWANIASHRPMTPDSILNIASVSKTFTTTALMQLWEKGRFQLDDPVTGYLPFPVRHPRFDTRITFRHLLTHTSGIRDSLAYYTSYSCGDPLMSLEDWLKGYLLPGGKFYNAEENFCPWSPGGDFTYSNVAYGLLGYLVECISGTPFTRYCREQIFSPLMMNHSGWLLSEVDLSNHAVPYGILAGEEVFQTLYAEPGNTPPSQPVPLCLYSFPNLSDGLVRTSARQLAHFAAAFSIPRCDGIPLKPATMQLCFTPQLPARDVRDTVGIGLTWFFTPHKDDPSHIQYWGHDGGDPGVNTRLQLSLERRGAVIIFTNSNHSQESMNTLSELIWQVE
jgi:CubicO group peptidase (beta-lactamase class C family)